MKLIQRTKETRKRNKGKSPTKKKKKKDALALGYLKLSLKYFGIEPRMLKTNILLKI